MISVVVPIYNTEKYLKQCVDSILNQTYHDLDIILVDDGSTDSCGLICDEYAKADLRVRTYHIDNIGISGARNFGINQARERKPKYIYFADSDDWLDLNMLEVMHNAAEKQGADIAVCGVLDVFLDGSFLSVQEDNEYDHIDAIKCMLNGSFRYGVWNKLWKFELFDEIEFPNGMYYEDIVTNYYLFEKANKTISVSMVKYHYRKRIGSIVHLHNIKRLQDWFYAAQKMYVIFDEGPFSDDKQIRTRRLGFCAIVAINIWTFLSNCSPVELIDAEPLRKTIIDFAREHFTINRINGFSFPLKCGALFVRRDKKINYFLVKLLNRGYNLRKEHRKLYD